MLDNSPLPPPATPRHAETSHKAKRILPSNPPPQPAPAAAAPLRPQIKRFRVDSLNSYIATRASEALAANLASGIFSGRDITAGPAAVVALAAPAPAPAASAPAPVTALAPPPAASAPAPLTALAPAPLTVPATAPAASAPAPVTAPATEPAALAPAPLARVPNASAPAPASALAPASASAPGRRSGKEHMTEMPTPATVADKGGIIDMWPAPKGLWEKKWLPNGSTLMIKKKRDEPEGELRPSIKAMALMGRVMKEKHENPCVLVRKGPVTLWYT